jgi:hypothetical protein
MICSSVKHEQEGIAMVDSNSNTLSGTRPSIARSVLGSLISDVLGAQSAGGADEGPLGPFYIACFTADEVATAPAGSYPIAWALREMRARLVGEFGAGVYRLHGSPTPTALQTAQLQAALDLTIGVQPALAGRLDAAGFQSLEERCGHMWTLNGSRFLLTGAGRVGRRMHDVLVGLEGPLSYVLSAEPRPA